MCVQGRCIIRAGFLDDIKQAYDRNKNLKNLLVDEFFATKLAEKQKAWRQVVQLSIGAGVSTPGLVSSLAYFDTYRSVHDCVSWARTRGHVSRGP